MKKLFDVVPERVYYNFMSKRSICLFSMTVFLFSACVSNTVKPAPVPAEPVQTPAGSEPADVPVPTAEPALPAETAPEDTIVAQFDTVAITKQTFENTKSEIQLVVEDLNRITTARDYRKWLDYLSSEYRNYFSNPVVLEEVSKSLPTKGIQLQSLKDYFSYVFVPSRQNMRVDDIQFVSPTRVYVIMEITPKSPAAIYILEKIDGGWKLVLKNQ
jgi:hypothetical protein